MFTEATFKDSKKLNKLEELLSIALHSILKCFSLMFATNLFNKCNSFVLPKKKMLKFDGIFDGVLMVLLLHLSEVSLSLENYVYLFLLSSLISLKLILNIGLNMLFNSSRKIFY